MSRPVAPWILEEDGTLRHATADVHLFYPDLDGDVEVQDGAEGRFWVPLKSLEGFVARHATPPRPWHYVTEALPADGQEVRFWVAYASPRCRVELFGRFDGEHFYVEDDDRFPCKPGNISGRWTYAWEPKPEPPPLPEVESGVAEALGRCEDTARDLRDFLVADGARRGGGDAL